MFSCSILPQNRFISTLRVFKLNLSDITSWLFPPSNPHVDVSAPCHSSSLSSFPGKGCGSHLVAGVTGLKYTLKCLLEYFHFMRLFTSLLLQLRGKCCTLQIQIIQTKYKAIVM